MSGDHYWLPAGSDGVEARAEARLEAGRGTSDDPPAGIQLRISRPDPGDANTDVGAPVEYRHAIIDLLESIGHPLGKSGKSRRRPKRQQAEKDGARADLFPDNSAQKNRAEQNSQE